MISSLLSQMSISSNLYIPYLMCTTIRRPFKSYTSRIMQNKGCSKNLNKTASRRRSRVALLSLNQFQSQKRKERLRMVIKSVKTFILRPRKEKQLGKCAMKQLGNSVMRKNAHSNLRSTREAKSYLREELAPNQERLTKIKRQHKMSIIIKR